MSEGLVGLCHLMSILAALDRSTEAVGGIEDFVGQTLSHGLLATGAGEVGEPAQRQRGKSPASKCQIKSQGFFASIALHL